MVARMFFLSSHSQERASPGPDSELDSSWRRPLWQAPGKGFICLFHDLERELRQPERGKRGAGRGRRGKLERWPQDQRSAPRDQTGDGKREEGGDRTRCLHTSSTATDASLNLVLQGPQAALSVCRHPWFPWKLNRPGIQRTGRRC